MKNKNELVFITEDGVRVDNKYAVVVVDEYFKKSHWEVVAMVKENFENTKVFAHESNADEYIWRNQRVFSYEDIIDFNTVEEGMWYDIKEIAKDRSGINLKK